MAAEADLAKQLAEATGFQEIVRARLRPLSDHLDELEEEIRSYERRLEQLKKSRLYDDNYPSIEEQIRENQAAGSDILIPVARDRDDAMQIRRLYHRLARKYHPDLAQDQLDEVSRNNRMAALNEAYASGSIVELIALSDSSTIEAYSRSGDDRTLEMLIEALEIELSRINRRLIEIEEERNNLHNHPIVQLSLQVKLARLNGQNLLSEMAVDLERQIESKTAQRDRLREELDYFGSQPGKKHRKKKSSPLARRIKARNQRSNLPQSNPSPKFG